MHVARNRRTYVARSGERRVYESVLVRRTYRDGGKVKHETLANLSALPGPAVDAKETHGTGCTFSAALAALVAQGRTLPDAVRGAKDFVAGALGAARQAGTHSPLGWRNAAPKE